MDTVDILECAELISETYTHDSVKDVVMALKMAKTKGHNFFNTVSTPIILDLIKEYMENKSAFTEKRSADNKSFYDGSVRTEAGTRALAIEKAEEERMKQMENKQLKQLQQEKREMKKISDFIEKNMGNVK